MPTAALVFPDEAKQTSLSQQLPQPAQEAVLSAENDSLRVLLEQAGIDAQVLLAQAGIDAKEREAADKLQKLILGDLHHRTKNTLATVSAIASQSFRTAPSIEHGQKAMDGRLLAMSRMMESVGQQLNGVVTLPYAPSGLIYTLDVPIWSITGTST